MVADKLWMEGATGALRWRSHRTTNPMDRSEGPLCPPVSPRVAQFADLYEEHARAVLRYCQLRIADPHEAEDAAALIFTRAFAAWPPDDPSAARAWLFTIAHNVVANHYRQQANRGPRQSLDTALELHDPAIGPLDRAIARERTAELRAAITQKLLFITQCDFDAWLLVTSLDSITAMLIGIIVDKVYAPGGLAGIDQYDFAKWLESHGMQKESDRTPFVQFIYDAAFSYFDGVSDGGERISAGTTIGIILRMGLAFDGAAYYKMQGGMGEIGRAHV